MKVTIDSDAKKTLHVSELESAKTVIKEMKENTDCTPASEIVYAISAFYRNECYDIDVLKAKATIAKNGRIFDYHGDGTGNIDIWIEATAQTSRGFIIIGAYLSDIWSIISSGDNDNRAEVSNHFFVREFTESHK